MSKMNFESKAKIVLLAFVLPITLLTVSSVRDFLEEKSFLKGEIQGVRLLAQVAPLELELVQMRNATRAGAGGFDSTADTAKSRVAIDTLFKSLDQNFQSDFDGGSLSSNWRNLQSSWHRAKSAPTGIDVETSSTVYLSVTEKSGELLQLISDASGLILDPEIDTLYLGLAATHVLPSLIENLGQVRAWSTYLAAKGDNLTFAEYTSAHEKFAIWDALLRANLKEYRSHYLKAKEKSPRIAQKLNIQFLENIESYRQLVYGQVFVEGSEAPDVLWSKGSRVFNEAGIQYQSIHGVLEELLENRLIGLYGKHLVLAAFTAFSLMIAGYFFLSFYRDSVRDLAQKMLDRAELRSAKHDAENASISKSQFLANMSHELRTPMGAILGMLKLLKATSLNIRQSDYVNKTEDAAKSLLGLLNDLLDFSKVEAGKMTLDVQLFNPDALMKSLSVILSANLGAKPLEILFDIDTALPASVLGDDMRLRQILINLGANAIKFTEKGEVVIALRVVSETDADIRVEFSVSDSGIGIASENISKVFTLFSQAESSTTRKFGGTGLGLAICQMLVRLMGGELKVDSMLGRGSRFYFEITLDKGIECIDEIALVPDTCVPTAQFRALVIDDNPMARRLMAKMVEASGWECDQAVDGRSALELVKHSITAANPYHVIFVDWSMPGLDGWQTSQEIRKLSTGAATPIVVMVSVHGRETLTQKSSQELSVIDGYLVKPVTATMLQESVRHALNPEIKDKDVGKAVDSRRLEGLRILIVEDNKINQQIALELLGYEGAFVTMAENGLKGVEAVRDAEHPFEAVLMDIQMPVMDGYQATHEIRNTLKLAILPIIAMTANAMASDREACLEAGMNDHVGKPFDIDHLVKVILVQTGRTEASHQSNHAPLNAKHKLSDRKESPQLAVTASDEEIDSASALGRLGGLTTLYKDLLEEFREELKLIPPQYSAFLQSDALGDAARLMHTLKGTSATIGAMKLSKLAADLERLCRSTPHLDAHSGRFEELIAQVDSTDSAIVSVCDGYSKRNETPKSLATHMSDKSVTEKELSRRQVVDLLRELCNLLDSNNMQALHKAQEITSFSVFFIPARIKDLQSAVKSLQFSDAKAICDELLCEIEVNASASEKI